MKRVVRIDVVRKRLEMLGYHFYGCYGKYYDPAGVYQGYFDHKRTISQLAWKVLKEDERLAAAWQRILDHHMEREAYNESR